MVEPNWSAGTFAGAAAASRRATASATPQQRLDWLEEALLLALAAGTLARVRERRQRAALEAWSD